MESISWLSPSPSLPKEKPRMIQTTAFFRKEPQKQPLHEGSIRYSSADSAPLSSQSAFPTAPHSAPLKCASAPP